MAAEEDGAPRRRGPMVLQLPCPLGTVIRGEGHDPQARLTEATMNAEAPVLHHEDQITLEASAQRAWDAIKDFDAIHTWHPAAVSTEMLVGENGRPLAVREFQVADGGFVISELLDYDEARRWFKYRIIKTSMPLRGYVAEMQVDPTEDGCTVRWWGTFHGSDPESADGFDPADAVKGIFRMGLENLPTVVGD